MSRFDELLAHADRSIDRSFGETFNFQPMREIINGEAVPDEDRATVAGVQGVFAEHAEDYAMQGGSGFSPGRVSAAPRLSIRIDEWQFIVQKFDRVTRLKTGQVYEVTKVLPDDLSRSILSLVAVAG